MLNNIYSFVHFTPSSCLNKLYRNTTDFLGPKSKCDLAGENKYCFKWFVLNFKNISSMINFHRNVRGICKIF